MCVSVCSWLQLGVKYWSSFFFWFELSACISAWFLLYSFSPSCLTDTNLSVRKDTSEMVSLQFESLQRASIPTLTWISLTNNKYTTRWSSRCCYLPLNIRVDKAIPRQQTSLCLEDGTFDGLPPWRPLLLLTLGILSAAHPAENCLFLLPGPCRPRVNSQPSGLLNTMAGRCDTEGDMLSSPDLVILNNRWPSRPNLNFSAFINGCVVDGHFWMKLARESMVVLLRVAHKFYHESGRANLPLIHPLKLSSET